MSSQAELFRRDIEGTGELLKKPAGILRRVGVGLANKRSLCRLKYTFEKTFRDDVFI